MSTRYKHGLRAGIVCLALLAGNAIASEAATPEAAPPAAVQDALDYYRDWVAFRQEYLRVPGVQFAVRAGDREVLAASSGLADVERHTALTNAHLFRVASHSKTFTSTTVMRLVERGRLRLDDTAGQWLPWLKDADSALAAVTVRELLSHAGGVIRDGEAADYWHLDAAFPDAQALRKETTAGTAAVIPANQRWKYSNVGYGLLGQILEAASGQSYSALLKQEIIDPLGLHSTDADLGARHVRNLATGYTALSYAPRRVPIDHVGTGALSPATGVVSNASELVNFFSTQFVGDTRLLDEAAKRRMQQPLWESSERGKYGLGLGISKIGERALVGHSGGFPGFSSMTLVDPKARVAVSVLTNAIDGPAGQMAQGFFHLLNLSSKPAPQDAPPRAQLTRFTGRYATLFSLTDVVLLGGRLYLISPTSADPSGAVPLVYVDDHTLKVDGGSVGTYGEPMTFTFKPDGSVASMRLGMHYLPIQNFHLPKRVRLAK